MNEEKKLRVIFTEKAEFLFSDILKNNGLEESDEEFFNKLEQDKEPKEIITRDAVTTIARKVIPEKKLVELLQKHLEVSQETAERIIYTIKSRLLPLLYVYPDEYFNDPLFREEVSKKVFGHEEKFKEADESEIKKQTDELIKKIETERNIHKPNIGNRDSLLPHIKTAPILNVEKNAENMEKEGRNFMTQQKNKSVKKTETYEEPQPQNSKPDAYREPTK